MGWYLNSTKTVTVPVRGKAQFLVDRCDAIKLKGAPANLSKPEGLGVVCVVSNAVFDAAAFVYSEEELVAFREEDGRPKVWLLLAMSDIKEMSGYKE